MKRYRLLSGRTRGCSGEGFLVALGFRQRSRPGCSAGDLLALRGLPRKRGGLCRHPGTGKHGELFCIWQRHSLGEGPTAEDGVVGWGRVKYSLLGHIEGFYFILRIL